MRVHKDNGEYYARVGDFFGPLKTTSAEALKALDDQLEKYRPLNHVYVRAKDGHVLHIFQIPSQGWTINIIGPDGYKGKGIGNNTTYQIAKEKALRFAIEHGGLVG